LARRAFIPSQPGCYSLIISLKRKKTVRVGKLGVALFPKGTYVYTGSAMGGLAARLKRHLTRKKKIRWHIDHLLKLPEARVDKVIVYQPTPNQECRQNQRIAALFGATIVLKRFGASDCKSGCASHLFLFAEDSESQLAAGSPLRSRFPSARRGTAFLTSRLLNNSLGVLRRSSGRTEGT
jgi:Uri superfamily endonuclease